MKTTKPRIAIIEDRRSQYRLIQTLINHYQDYDIVPNLRNRKEFMAHDNVVSRFVTGKELKGDAEKRDLYYKGVQLFIVDWELIQGNAAATGITFCTKMKYINNGNIPVLFLTSNEHGTATNPITRLKNEKSGIRYDHSEKDIYWREVDCCSEADMDAKITDVATRIINNRFYQTDIKMKIDALLKGEKPSPKPQQKQKSGNNMITVFRPNNK